MNAETRELTAEEYADQVISAYRVFADDEWTDEGRVAFVTDEVVGHIVRTAKVGRRDVDREAVEAMARERIAAARG